MTAQIGDDLWIDGDSAHLRGCPPLPWHHPRFKKRSPRGARWSARGTLIFSTACWREYQASWHIKQDRLDLTRTLGIYKLQGKSPLFAEWVCDELITVRGELREYVHLGFGSLYEEEVTNYIDRGVVRDVRTRRNARDDVGKFDRAAAHLPSIDTVTPGYSERD